MKNLFVTYGITGIIQLFFFKIRTKFIFSNARIIRFPIRVRGRKSIKVEKGFRARLQYSSENRLCYGEEEKKVPKQALAIGSPSTTVYGTSTNTGTTVTGARTISTTSSATDTTFSVTATTVSGTSTNTGTTATGASTISTTSSATDTTFTVTGTMFSQDVYKRITINFFI